MNAFEHKNVADCGLTHWRLPKAYQVNKAHADIQNECTSHLVCSPVKYEGMEPRHNSPQTQGGKKASSEGTILYALESFHQGHCSCHAACICGIDISEPLYEVYFSYNDDAGLSEQLAFNATHVEVVGCRVICYLQAPNQHSKQVQTGMQFF